MQILPLLVVLVAFTASAADPQRKGSGSIGEGGVLPQIVQGGAWATELQVVNTDDEGRPIPYTISFFRDGAMPMNVRVFDGNGTDLGTMNITTVRLTTHGRAATDCSSISYDCFSLAAI